jgi:hypothetical protein
MVPYQDPPPDPPAYDNGIIALTVFEPGPDEDGNPLPVPRGSMWGFNTADGFSRAQFAPAVSAGAASEMVAVDLDATPEEGSPGDDRVFLLFEGSNAMMEFFPGEFDSTNYILYQ